MELMLARQDHLPSFVLYSNNQETVSNVQLLRGGNFCRPGCFSALLGADEARARLDMAC